MEKESTDIRSGIGVSSSCVEVSASLSRDKNVVLVHLQWKPCQLSVVEYHKVLLAFVTIACCGTNVPAVCFKREFDGFPTHFSSV